MHFLIELQNLEKLYSSISPYRVINYGTLFVLLFRVTNSDHFSSCLQIYRLWRAFIPPIELQTLENISLCRQSYRLQYTISLFPYRVIDSGNHFFYPVELHTLAHIHACFLMDLQTLATFLFALQNYRLWKKNYAYRVADSGNISLCLIELQTLEVVHHFLIELQTLTFFPFAMQSYRLWQTFSFLPYRVTDSNNHSQPYRVTNSSNLFFLPCRVIDSGRLIFFHYTLQSYRLR